MEILESEPLKGVRKRGPKPKGGIRIEWSSGFAYGIGLIASDGYVSKDCRHVSFVSKDLEQVQNYMRAFCIENRIRKVFSKSGNKAYVIQFSDAEFWNYLNRIGIGPAKSKTILSVDVPDEFFLDFLRGLFDGDRSFYSYFDRRWKSCLMFYIAFSSASYAFTYWLRKEIERMTGLKGHISGMKKKEVFQLRYAKKESLVLISRMYENINTLHLSRKKLKIQGILCMMPPQAQGHKGR